MAGSRSLSSEDGASAAGSALRARGGIGAVGRGIRTATHVERGIGEAIVAGEHRQGGNCGANGVAGGANEAALARGSACVVEEPTLADACTCAGRRRPSSRGVLWAAHTRGPIPCAGRRVEEAYAAGHAIASAAPIARLTRAALLR